MKIIFIFLIFIFLAGGYLNVFSQSTKPNIVFIAVDDLRADLGCYGNFVVKSPNLDKLGKNGFVFQNHFVNVPTCGASRQCLLTGNRPTSALFTRNDITEKIISEKLETKNPESFIHHLKRNGYHTVGIGKISHSADGYVYAYNEKPSNKRELPFSWDELDFDYGKWGTGWNAFFGYANGESRGSLKKEVKPYEMADVDDTGYVDGLTCELAIKKLRGLQEKSEPFFLGVGFFKPHLPFNAPKKYWDLYNRDSIPLSPNPNVPSNVSLKSLHGSDEVNNGYHLTDEKASLTHRVSDAYARKLKHGYYSCISYIDEQIGKIVKEINDLGLEKNTIIVVWGDHGWHLGDQQVWGKHTIFDNALKSVLIIKLPGKQVADNVSAIVETVDIYPTLMDLCGVKMPNKIDGESFAGILKGEGLAEDQVAYGYFRKGISLRTKRYRLSRYFRDEQPNIELYDHLADPFETNNIAQDNPSIVKKLMPLLEKGNTHLYK
ncbi:MAG: sulfatase [Bacteroidales bacterium]|nr:MAG: sulfatase [Bacteroidales bacterium]